MTLESKEEAIQRHNSEKFKKEKKKSPVGMFDKKEWDEEEMKAEVMAMMMVHWQTSQNWDGDMDYKLQWMQSTKCSSKLLLNN